MKNYDIVVVGGSIGGVLAAKRAAELGKKTLLIERTRWIGGQFTNQAVPPDEHPFIESFGSTQSYRSFRNRIREYMKEHYPIKPEIRNRAFWNPGHASVSRLSAPPSVFLTVFYEMLQEVLGKTLDLLLEHEAIEATVLNHEVQSLLIRNIPTNETFEVKAEYVIDGTDTGELLTLTDTLYRVGREARSLFHEPNALETADSEDLQPVTWVACVEYCPNENHIIPKPEQYDFFRSFQKSRCGNVP